MHVLYSYCGSFMLGVYSEENLGLKRYVAPLTTLDPCMCPLWKEFSLTNSKGPPHFLHSWILFPTFPCCSGWLWHVTTAVLGCDWSHDEAGFSQAVGITKITVVTDVFLFVNSTKGWEVCCWCTFEGWFVAGSQHWRQMECYHDGINSFLWHQNQFSVRTRSDASKVTIHGIWRLW